MRKSSPFPEPTDLLWQRNPSPDSPVWGSACVSWEHPQASRACSGVSTGQGCCLCSNVGGRAPFCSQTMLLSGFPGGESVGSAPPLGRVTNRGFLSRFRCRLCSTNRRGPRLQFTGGGLKARLYRLTGLLCRRLTQAPPDGWGETARSAFGQGC